MSMQVANTILQQIGGNRFIAMTGAKNFVGGSNFLAFALPRGFAKNKANKVRITLTPADLYKVEFFSMYRLDIRTIKEVDGLYADQLQDVFTAETGLDTRM